MLWQSRFRIMVVLLVILLAVQFAAVQSASAAGESWVVTSVNSIGCANAGTSFITLVSGIASFPTTLRFRTIVDAGGLRYMDEDAGSPGSNGTYGWSLYNSSSGGPTTASFPLPPDTPITVQFLLINGVGGPTVTSHVITITKCNGGTVVGGFSGPALPPPSERNLVLVVNSTAVFDAPDGEPTGDAIYGCQTAFIIATSDDGKWGQLFVMGGWIPLSATIDVAEDYGQPGGAPIYAPCVGK